MTNDQAATRTEVTAGGVAPARRWNAARTAAWTVAAILGLIVIAFLWNQSEKLVTGESGSWASYLLIAALIFGDAIFPVLPGETTLNAGAVLAANGQLNIWLVALAGAVGAIVGDSTLYWLARRAKGRVRNWLDRAAAGNSGVKMTEILRRRGPAFLLFGRYIPGVRFALNVALGGVVRMPYARFLAWSSLSGILWSLFTCSTAYFISAALVGYPVLSLVAACLFSTVLLALVLIGQKYVDRWRETHHSGRA